MTAEELLRQDLRLIADLVPQGARVLDLGCGDGSLLEQLRDERGAFVRGVELDLENVALCIERGLSVFQGDLDEGLADFRDDSFDVVILSQTLQVVRKPQLVLREMLRVGERGLISVPNFGYWRTRATLALRGRMPVNPSIPYEWYDTPNIHHTTIRDFRRFCESNGAHIERMVAIAGTSAARKVPILPNLLAGSAVFVVTRESGDGRD